MVENAREIHGMAMGHLDLVQDFAWEAGRAHHDKYLENEKTLECGVYVCDWWYWSR